MKLHSVQVTNFKCIDDSGKFRIGNLTCLAGKNESGKTALLQALRRLNPVEDSENDFDELMEYPRRRRHEITPDSISGVNVLTTIWELSEEDLTAVWEIVGQCAFEEQKVTVRRGYNNETLFDFSLNEAKIIPFLTSKIPELTTEEKERLSVHANLSELHSTLVNSDSRTDGEAQLRQYIEEQLPGFNPRVPVTDLLKERLPRLLYFPTYGTIPGKVSVNEIVQKLANESAQSEGDRYFLALLSLAGLDIPMLRDVRRSEELIARLEGVSNHMTDVIFEYWSQNSNLEVQFNYIDGRPEDPPPFNNGHIVGLRVRNQRHRVSVEFDERSTGFVWFFSFLVWFSEMEKRYGDRLIILLDEPGLSLHARAQADLLRYIKEKLLPNFQVIYTTHSPFMIDTDDIFSVRTVEDLLDNGQPIGTKVSNRVLSADSDTLFPLRAALGYDITQSLFVGEHSLLVEGPSDLLYLRWASRQLVKRGFAGLDHRWTITPVGGIDKVGSFNALFSGNALHVAIFTDFHSGERRKVEELRESGMLEVGHVFTADQFVDQDQADTEDLLGRTLYIEIVNRCYELEGEKRLPETPPDDPSTLVLNEVVQHFRLVATEGPEFDHLSPAVYLVEHESDFQDVNGIEELLGRFQQFFDKVNALLPST